MSLPLMFLTTWLLLGMVTTMSAWSSMGDELELALGEEEEELRGVLRVLLVAVFVIVWPLLVMDLLQRR
jgi:hypothetical protein